jgi:hypothetical protein
MISKKYLTDALGFGDFSFTAMDSLRKAKGSSWHATT